MNKVIMFAGQGSQRLEMGKELFSKYDDYVKLCDKVLGYSIVDLCMGKIGDLNRTLYTQVALYVVNHLLFLEWRENNPEEEIEYFIGHSLGEYNALCASKVFSFEDGLQLIVKRAQLMDSQKGGSMAAVLKMEEGELRETLMKENKVDMANINTLEQIVISGQEKDMSEMVTTLKEKGVKVIPLRVSGAFHSRYMSQARQQFEQYVETFDFLEFKTKVVANKTGLPYNNEEVKKTLVDQIDHSVQWVKTIQYIKSQGDFDFVEIAVKSVLTSFLKRI